MAESEGFEPPIALRLCLISSQVHSTGLCQLSVFPRRPYESTCEGVVMAMPSAGLRASWFLGPGRLAWLRAHPRRQRIEPMLESVWTPLKLCRL